MRRVDEMARSFGGAALGAVLGLGCGVVVMSVGGSDQYIYLRNAISVVLCVGLGSIAGAIVGAAGAIVDAIHRDREERPR
jgi:uncharacterized membrane protein